MEIECKTVIEGIVAGVTTGIIFTFFAGIWSLLTMRERKLRRDRERLIDWRMSIIQRLDKSCFAKDYLKRQFEKKKRPYKYQKLRREFPVDEMCDPASDL